MEERGKTKTRKIGCYLGKNRGKTYMHIFFSVVKLLNKNLEVLCLLLSSFFLNY